jgi:hypothetical protein
MACKSTHWKKQNPEKVQRHQSTYYQRHKDHLKRMSRLWKQKNAEAVQRHRVRQNHVNRDAYREQYPDGKWNARMAR